MSYLGIFGITVVLSHVVPLSQRWGISTFFPKLLFLSVKVDWITSHISTLFCIPYKLWGEIMRTLEYLWKLLYCPRKPFWSTIGLLFLGNLFPGPLFLELETYVYFRLSFVLFFFFYDKNIKISWSFEIILFFLLILVK